MVFKAKLVSVLGFLLLNSFIHAELENFTQLGESDWPWWRGPQRNAKAMKGENPPLKWSESENIKWKSKVSGRGHASPIVVGNSVVLATGDSNTEVQSVISYDKATGKKIWETTVHKGGFSPVIHKKNTHASQTVASDGEQVYVAFDNSGKIFATALNLKTGKIVWQKEAGIFNPQKYKFGYGSSPLIYGKTFIVVAESDMSSKITAFDLNSGSVVWETKRELNLNWASPTVAHLEGKDQLLLSGNKKITSYDPKTGKELWSEKASATATCGTCVWDGDLVFASGGYPEKETAAVRVGGKGLAWKTREKTYEPSMLADNGLLYAITDTGTGYCWRSKDGELMWKQKIVRALSASPILVGDLIYIAGGRGETVVFEHNAKEYVEIARNKLGDENYTTPAFSENQIFIRVVEDTGSSKQEWLYCIGK